VTDICAPFPIVLVHEALTFEVCSQNCKKWPLVLSCLSCMEQLSSHWSDMHEIWYCRIFWKSVK